MAYSARSELPIPPPGSQFVEVEDRRRTVRNCTLGGRSIMVDHDGLAHDEPRSFIADPVDCVLGANPFVLSEKNFAGIFIGFHHFDVDLDRLAVRRTRFEMQE